jgi:hypothetical protein
VSTFLLLPLAIQEEERLAKTSIRSSRDFSPPFRQQQASMTDLKRNALVENNDNAEHDTTNVQTARPSSPSSSSSSSLSSSAADELTKQYGPASQRLITFYYTWYANPQHDRSWAHWDHKILVDNGRKMNADRDEIGSASWPLLGLYSSADVNVIDEHMRMLRRARIGVLCLTWWGANDSDEQLKFLPGFTDRVVPLLMDRAAAFGITVCFHIEPYTGENEQKKCGSLYRRFVQGRNALTVAENAKYIVEKYGTHSAFFRTGPRKLPLFFVYDSYLVSENEFSSYA